MTPDRYEQIRSLYVRAANVPPHDRNAFLARTCDDLALRREVEALLSEDTKSDFLETPALGQAFHYQTTPLEVPTRLSADEDDHSDADPVAIPKSIGSYTIRSVLGQGGMGTVYLAQQVNPNREVALKVMRAGTSSSSMLRRFRHEAEILGRLQHPGIAQIYEAGAATTEAGKQPFFAMERVVGSTLTDYARKKKLNLRQRVELLACICDAVQHAHQKGVIHRDLKPANILIDAHDQPKILDFGVARLADNNATTAAETHAGALIGTIPYMSPEQIAGGRNDIDTRSDVYALGVVAFELLSGILPHNVREKSVYEAARTIREEEPTRLASQNRALRGDLETIVSTALAKDPDRRYQSAAALGSDLRRYLRHETIMARPSSTLYQLQKIARRHRAAFLGISSLFVALVLGAIGTSYGLIQARENAILAAKEAERARDNERRANVEKDRARISAARAGEVSAFLRGMMSAADPEKVAGVNLTVRDVLDEAALRVRTNPPTDPTVAAMVHITLADTYRALGAMETAEAHVDSAELLAQEHENVPLEIQAECFHVRSRIRLDTGQFAEALPSLERELATYKNIPNPDPVSMANCHVKRGEVFIGLNDFETAEQEVQTALKIREENFGTASSDYADALTLQARLRRAQARFADARESIEIALEIFRANAGADHPSVARSETELAGVYLDEGRPSDAVPLFEDAARIARTSYGDEHHAVATALNNLAAAQIKVGQFAAAIDNLAEGTRIYRKVLPQNVRHIAILLQNRATLLINVGRLEEAEAGFREALPLLRESLPEDNPTIASALNGLGGVLRRMERYAESEEAYRDALRIRRAAYSDEHPAVATTMSNLAWLRHAQGDVAGAIRLHEDALAIRRKIFPNQHPDIAHSLAGLARIQIDEGNAADALPATLEALEIRRAALGARSWITLRSMLLAAEAHRVILNYDKAAALLEEARDVAKRYPEDFSPRQTNAIERQRALLFDAMGKGPEAARIREQLVAE